MIGLSSREPGEPWKGFNHERYDHVVFDNGKSRVRVYWRKWDSSEEFRESPR